MNRSIVRLFGVVILLFTVLIVWTSRWTVFSADALNSNPLNRLQFYASLKVKRGEIIAGDGHTILARSVPAGGGTWTRVYPTRGLFSQTVGYYFPQNGQPPTGLEASRNDELHGLQDEFTSVFGNFNGGTKVGDDVHTTLDPTAQRLAQRELQQAITDYHATSGSVVAIVPQTGAVKVLYSSPTYNNNDPSACGTGCSTYFDALQGRYPPGSTFKLVTSTAALDTGKYTPTSPLINGKSPIIVSGRPLENDSNEQYGYVDLTEALTNSINTVFAQVGENVGAVEMQKYMERYGFYSVPPMDFPANQMTASGEIFYKPECRNRSNTPKLVPVTNPCVDLGRTAIGQANLAVTPMQMAMVVSGIANDGRLMEPRLTTRVVNNDGQTVETVQPHEYDQVMAPKYAKQLQVMMRDVVEEGTGQAANLGGLNIAGKTGTAETGLCYQNEQPVAGNCPNGQPLDDAWFVGFPEGDPKIAVAVELSDVPNGYGGQFAAPIAAQVIKTVLTDGQ